MMPVVSVEELDTQPVGTILLILGNQLDGYRSAELFKCDTDFWKVGHSNNMLVRSNNIVDAYSGFMDLVWALI